MKHVIVIFLAVATAIHAFADYGTMNIQSGNLIIPPDIGSGRIQKALNVDVWSTTEDATVSVRRIRTMKTYTNIISVVATPVYDTPKKHVRTLWNMVDWEGSNKTLTVTYDVDNNPKDIVPEESQVAYEMIWATKSGEYAALSYNYYYDEGIGGTYEWTNSWQCTVWKNGGANQYSSFSTATGIVQNVSSLVFSEGGLGTFPGDVTLTRGAVNTFFTSNVVSYVYTTNVVGRAFDAEKTNSLEIASGTCTNGLFSSAVNPNVFLIPGDKLTVSGIDYTEGDDQKVLVTYEK